tara:strand:+ start:314 stop:805 length:492 start_codon:yes stop_codon:yes gene_type:complete
MYKKKQGEVVVNLRRTRKAFLPEYISGFFLLFVLFIFNLNNIAIPFNLNYLLIGVAAFAFISIEVNRKLVDYKITPEKIIITKGIIKKHRKNIHFHPLGFVPDINVKQNFTQRLLNYGTVFIEGSGENHLEIKDVSNPHKILSTLEDLIDENRTTSSKRPLEG